MKRGECLKTLCKVGPGAAGEAVVQEGMAQIAEDLNALANGYRADLPLLVACIKGSLPHWERALGETGRELCREFMESMMTIDASMLKGEKS